MDALLTTRMAKNAYNRIARKYHDSFKNEIAQKPFDRETLDRFSHLLRGRALVCDAGCGPSGHMGKYLSDKGHIVHGIDVSELCADIASRYNDGLEYEVMDMFSMGFRDNAFDGVIAFYSIVYAPRVHVGSIFSEFRRVLKPGGKLLVVVKKGAEEGVVDDGWYEGNPVYFSHFMEDDLLGYCRHAGLRVDSIETRPAYAFEIPVDRLYLVATKGGTHPR